MHETNKSNLKALVKFMHPVNKDWCFIDNTPDSF